MRPPAGVLDWNISVDYDPFINGSITLTNFTSSAKNYTVFLDLPVRDLWSHYALRWITDRDCVR